MASLETDPRTGLRLLDVPNVRALNKIGEKSGILYWFGNIVAYGGNMEPKQRMMMITDQAIYLMTERELMKRCWLIKDIESLYLDQARPSLFIMKHAQPPKRSATGTVPLKDPDFIGELQSQEDRDEVIYIVDQVYRLYKGQPLLKNVIPLGALPEHYVNTAKQPGWKVSLVDLSSRVSLEQNYPAPQSDPSEEKARLMFQDEFEKVKSSLKYNLSGYRAEDFDAATREIDLYIDMLDDRDREIERLKHLRDTVFDDPNVWARCPNCRERDSETASRDIAKTIHSLQRQIEDAEHILDHLQHSRAASTSLKGQRVQRLDPHKRSSALSHALDTHQVSESTQVIQRRQRKQELQAKVKSLRDIIVENPVSYPTKEARRDALTRVGPAPKDSSEHERHLAQKVYDLDRVLADKDKELRLTKSIMRESFMKQVDQLEKLKKDFEVYDSEVVTYLEKVFAGEVFPKGAHEGQGPREQAVITAEAARSAATPVRIPELPSHSDMRFVHHSTADPYLAQNLEERSPARAWLGSHLEPLSQRLLPSTTSVGSRKSLI